MSTEKRVDFKHGLRVERRGEAFTYLDSKTKEEKEGSHRRIIAE